MENSARVPTVNDMKEKVLFWAVQLRMAEKAIFDAPEGTVSAAKRRHKHVLMQFNQAVDIYQGKLR